MSSRRESVELRQEVIVLLGGLVKDNDDVGP